MKYYLPTSLFFLCILFFYSCDSTPPTNPSPKELGVVFPDVSYTSVIAYHFEDLEGNPIISKEGILNPTIKKEKVLSEEEIQVFLKTINDPKTYGGLYTRCFKPRLGLVFYNEDKAVAHISICFECSQQMAFPQIKAYAKAPQGEHGYSEAGFRKLTSFCHELGFGQCGE
ncbi:hypothetical protein [Aureispira sp. CCB-E]|uniref:hypothetical protein n=1 Tax=Aureispira sp. CCB-E TaxID=3051121 RepID=UPI002868C99A|nr:hypothetical protein [Aureispira sp. CCB-E]WMX15401.1 hypothetical protein QP953_03310 [Aureispira sp. CCB-E]